MTSENEQIIADARRIFELQRAHRWAMAQTTPSERVARLEKLRTAVLAHREELARAVHLDFRKHADEFDLTEVQVVLGELRHALTNLGAWLEPKAVRTPMVLAGTSSEIRYEPKGVVLILGPWNYPFQLMIAPLVAAVAAGNCVMLRPSEKTPAMAEALRKMLSSAFDEREVALVAGGVPVSDALLELPFDHYFFTGSPHVGKKVMLKAAEHLASVTLELGGKSPVIIDSTADLKAAADRVAWGKFINAGQTCVAPDYVLVHASKKDAFVNALRASIERSYGATEETRKASPDFCRIITTDSHRRLASLLEQSVARGAKVELGGHSDESERYLSPTILSDVTFDSPIMGEEIFGPILPVLAWEKLDELLELMQRAEKPLAMYVFSKNEAFVERVLAGTTAGGTVVNNVAVHLGNANLPFGGVGASGMGSYHGEHGIRAFSHERAVMRQGRPALLKLLYPPYTKRTKQLLRWVQRLVD